MKEQYLNPPAGYHTITPYIIVKGANRAIEFYKVLFEATEIMRFEMPGGQIAHAEILIGDARLMIADENPAFHSLSPETIGGSASGIHLYVRDVDSLFSRAMENGARSMSEPKDQFYGDRSASFIDPFGHHWSLATRKENLSDTEIKKRMSGIS